MSGPVTSADAPAENAGPADPGVAALEIYDSREAQVGALRVRRALPRRQHRTVGAWCFADHMGPASVTETGGVAIGPHPHIGLQTVTWLVAGEILHRDSLGSEQVIRAGQLNLMTAGTGVSHSEEATGSYRGELHGMQLWVAQPERTRHGAAAFEHHAELPPFELAHALGTVIVGTFDDVTSPARCDTDHVGVDLELRPGTTTMPLRREYEYALVVLDAAATIEGTIIGPGHLAYLGRERDELELSVREDTRALLLGGVPFPEPILMWWNFVARTTSEIEQAYGQWQTGDPRFGRVASPLARIETDPPYEVRSSRTSRL